MRTLVVLVAACLGLAGVLLVVQLRSPEERSPPPVTGEVEDLRAEVSRLRRQVGHLNRMPPPQPAPPAGAVAVAPDLEPEPLVRQEPPSMEEAKRRLATGLGARFQAENVDGQWAPRVIAQIRTVLGGLGLPVTLAEARCATTVCRLVVELPDVETQAAMAEAVSQTEPFDQQVFYDLDVSVHPHRATVYLSRPGHPLVARANGP